MSMNFILTIQIYTQNSVLQETVHVRELMNSNMCFVCVSCLSVCVFQVPIGLTPQNCWLLLLLSCCC